MLAMGSPTRFITHGTVGKCRMRECWDLFSLPHLQIVAAHIVRICHCGNREKAFANP